MIKAENGKVTIDAESISEIFEDIFYILRSAREFLLEETELTAEEIDARIDEMLRGSRLSEEEMREEIKNEE